MASNARRKSMLEKTPTTKVQTFLDRFGKALEQGHIGDVVNMFQADCYWRDLVTFTWNLKTMEGKDQIREMLNRPWPRQSLPAGKWPKERKRPRMAA
jgi:hypothetical protein